MDFAERFNILIQNHGMNKKGIAMRMGIPYSTLLYKSTRRDSWTVVDGKKLINAMNLEAAEMEFLFSEG